MKLPLGDKLVGFAGMEGGMEVSGEIIRVFDKKEGEGEFGAWSFQKVIIKDADGEATLSLSKRSETLANKDIGKFININSNETKKGGHKGVKVDNREYKAKDGSMQKSLEIVVTGHATIEINGTATAEHDRVVASVSESKEEAPEALADKAAWTALAEGEKWAKLIQIRKESIQETFNVWLLTLIDSKIELTPEVYAAMIRVVGPNADTLFLTKVGRR